MRRYKAIGLAPALGAACTILAGCAKSQPARFYLLAPISTVEFPAAASARERPPLVAISPGSFPDYLDRPQIVTRSGENRLELAEFDRWAEPLKQNALRVLAENLSVLLGTELVTVGPLREPAPIDFRIHLEVLRLDGAPGKSVTLVARWAVTGRNGAEVAPMSKSVHEVPAPSPGYEGFAAAMSESLARLAREIANAINHKS